MKNIMKEKLDSIAIVCVCDDHYSVLLAALLKSIECNHLSLETLEVFVVEDGISSINKAKIYNYIDSNLMVINWLPLSDCIPDNAKLPIDNSSAPLNVYARLFIPQFIPNRIKKVIYLDVDMIVLEDVSYLNDIALEGKIAGAVQDQFIQVVSRWGGISNYEELGISADNPYFNSGLMIIDIQKWIEGDVTTKVLDAISKNKKHLLYQDQYGLNAVLFDSWLQLNPSWNRFAYSEEDSPKLIHFTGRKPIYKSYEFRKDFQQKFFQYLNMTGFKNFKPIGESHRYLKKIYNIIEKIIQKFSVRN